MCLPIGKLTSARLRSDPLNSRSNCPRRFGGRVRDDKIVTSYNTDIEWNVTALVVNSGKELRLSNR
jgi:hypothetical protein